MRAEALTWDQARRREKELAYEKLRTVEESLRRAAVEGQLLDAERLLSLSVLVSEARILLRRVTV